MASSIITELILMSKTEGNIFHLGVILPSKVLKSQTILYSVVNEVLSSDITYNVLLIKINVIYILANHKVLSNHC